MAKDWTLNACLSIILGFFHIGISRGLIERGASTYVNFVTCPDKSHAPGKRLFLFNVLPYKNLFSNPITCILILSMRIKAVVFPIYSFNLASLSTKNEACSITTQTPELQDVCAPPVHLQTSLCLHLELLQRKICFVLSGLLHQSTALTQLKFS